MNGTTPGNPQRIDGLLVRAGSEGALVLADPATGNTLITNRIGRKIIDLADGSRPPGAIAERLSAEYPAVDREKLGREVERFLEDAAGKGIVVWSRGSANRSSRPALQVTSEERGGLAEARERERRFHPHLYWYLTFRCNLACTHCSVGSSPWVDASGDLDTAGCLEVVEQMAEMNVGAALLSGGEVLIRPDALTILRALGDRGIFVGLETNGLRIDHAFVDMARELQERNLLGMTISVDGGTRETHEALRGPHSFDRTVRGLRLLADAGVAFDIQCVLNGGNYGSIPQLYDLAASLSPACGSVLLGVLNAVGRGADLIRRIGLHYDDIPKIFDLIHEHKGKFAGVNMIKFPPAMVPPKHLLTVYKGRDVGCSTSCQFPLLGVLPNGDITICAMGRTEESLCFGNIRSTRLKDVWQKTRMDYLRSRYVTAEKLTGICADCVWKRSCKGSCRAWAYLEGESFDAPYPVCQEAAEQGRFPDEYRISKQRQGAPFENPGA